MSPRIQLKTGCHQATGGLDSNEGEFLASKSTFMMVVKERMTDKKNVL